MKYEVLNEYERNLAARAELQPGTIKKYRQYLSKLLEGQSIIATKENLDVDKLIENLSTIKYKNYFSLSKNALLYFLKYQGIFLTEKQQNQINTYQNKTHNKYRNQSEVDFDKVNKTINRLKNENLRMCFQTLIATGLRVSELEQVTSNRTTLTEQEIIFSFTGKGGNQESTSIEKEDNPKLYQVLKNRVESSQAEERLFYSAKYLQKKAKEYGFKCHDLRRASAKLEYKRTKSKKKVQEKLRHSNIKTTNIYLKSKVKIKGGK